MTAPLRILIVEDDMLTANDIRSTLEHAGHTVTAIVREPGQTMRALKKESPDLALIDITLGQTAYAGIGIAKEILDYQWLPFIYLTGHTEPEVIEKATSTLPAAYLLKPFRKEELLVQVRLAYEHFQLRAEPGIPAIKDQNIYYLPNKNGHERFSSDDILYLKAQGHCTNIFLATEKIPHMIGTNLGNLIRYFTSANFFRMSKSLFINLDQLRRVEKNHIYLGKENTVVDISEANRKELIRRLNVIRTK